MGAESPVILESNDLEPHPDAPPRSQVYVEFDLSGGQVNTITHAGRVSHEEAAETPNVHSAEEKAIAEQSESHGSRQKVNLSVNLEDDDWQEMAAANDQEIYGEKGEVLVNQKEDTPEAGDPFASRFGYTRIAGEEQAVKYQESDSKTAFLFKASAKPREPGSVRNGGSREDATDDDTYDAIDEDLFTESHSATDQLNTTKDLLTDSEKLAYSGLVKLVMQDMATSLAKWGVSKTAKSGKSRFVKRMHVAQSSLGFWQVKIMNRIYFHLDIPENEIKMMEALVSHSINPEDLASSLQRFATVNNPAYEKDENTEKQEMKQGVIRPEDTSADENLDIDVRWTVICDLFLMLISDSIYDARSRTLLLKFAQYLGVEAMDVYQFERRITEALELEDTSEQVWNEEQILKNRRKLAKRRKYVYVGLATVGGSLVLGLSGGLLAPVIGAGVAAGLSTIGIGGTAGFLAGAGGTSIIAVGSTALGARAGLSGMLKRVGDVQTFEFVPLHNNKRTNLIVTVSGWMNSKSDDVRLPFSTIDPVMGDLYSVLWEPELLRSMGETISILASEVLTQSIQQILGATILMALMSALQLPMALSKLKYLIDNPWNVSLDRAWKAGLVLADTLIARNLGERPITLVGFSLGSRVIYSCLLELAKRGAHGIVEDVIIFGAPVVGSKEQLMLARSVVSGRFVNAYSKKDWILGYLFRATSGGLRRVTGLSPINDIDGIQNFDCTNHVEGHMGYRTAMPKLLKKLGFRVLSEEFVEIDEPDPEATERQRKLIMEFDEARKLMEQEGATAKKKGLFGKWMRPKKKEWWDIYSESRNSSQESLSRKSTAASLSGFDVDKVMDKVEKIKLGTDEKDGATEKENQPIDLNDDFVLAEEDDLKDELGLSNAERISPFDKESSESLAVRQHDRSTDDITSELDSSLAHNLDEEEFPTKENITLSFN